MRVLIVNKFLYPNGGSETYIFEVGKQLQKMGHEVQFFGMRHENNIVGNKANSYTDQMDFHAGKISKLIYPFKIIYSIDARKKILKILKDFDPDIIHLNNFSYQITPSILYEVQKYEKKIGKKIKIVATIHDPQLVCPNHMLINGRTQRGCDLCFDGNFYHCAKDRCIHSSFLRSMLGSIESYLYRYLHSYKMIDLIICPSSFIQEKMECNPDLKGRTVMLRNFISLDYMNQNGIEKDQSKEKYVLYFGRYSEEKGVKTLLKVARELKDIPFVFAGSGPFEKEADEIENIENKGFLKGQDLIDVISKASFTVIASECFENCPFSVMESQMLGTTVVGANIGGIPELIRDGIDGELFESGNAEELKTVIFSLFYDEEKIDEYSSKCKKIKYDSIVEYCEKLEVLYY